MHAAMDTRSSVVLEPIVRVLGYTVPKLQRFINDEHVERMVADQRMEYDRYGCFSMLQSFTVGVAGKDIWILDGQHRAKAFKELGDMGYPLGGVLVPVVVYRVCGKEELTDYYNRINTHMPIHPFETAAAWEDCGKVFCDMMKRNFGGYMKDGGVGKLCRCPHMTWWDLKANLEGRRVGERLEGWGQSVLGLWEKVLDVNAYIRLRVKAKEQLCSKMSKRLRECELKAAKLGVGGNSVCYLGIWKKYEWLDIAMRLLELGESMAGSGIGVSDFEEKRGHVPVAVREAVWKKHNCNMSDVGECFVCGEGLRFCDMECGHIVAHALGGKEVLDNFMPVCKRCNKDMGIMNLMDYKAMLLRMRGDGGGGGEESDMEV